MQPQNHASKTKKLLILLATSLQVQQEEPIAYDPIASVFPCTNTVVPFVWTLTNVQADLENFLVEGRLLSLGCNTKVFKRDNNSRFSLVQNITFGESGSTQSMRLMNQLTVGPEHFDRHLKPVSFSGYDNIQGYGGKA